MKNTSKKIIAILLGLALLLVFIQFSAKNNFVKLSNDLDGQWASYESALIYRSSKLTGLINACEAQMQHEKDIYKDLFALKEYILNENTNYSYEEIMKSNQEIDSGLSNFLVLVTNYPELKSIENFTMLMDEIAGAENRIKYARDQYNKAVTNYNNTISTFPGNFFFSDVEKKEYIRATEIEQQQPLFK